MFRDRYKEALRLNQTAIEAICISSLSTTKNEVDARYVNLKICDNNKFIFFTNYNSNKAKQFKEHSQISASIYWKSINTQIRIQAKISKTDTKFNNIYFANRDIKKNALAISSNQSNKISSYKDVKKKYKEVLQNRDLIECPKYWGGYAFVPYKFEFWEGHQNRLNKRDEFIINKDMWQHSILEP